jgi:glycosyltransferase involved in cell wall biosynthesis
MKKQNNQLISLVIPMYNESNVLPIFHTRLVAELKAAAVNYEIIYCDDGSADDSVKLVQQWSKDHRIKLIKLSRNFGKEIATTAGIHAAKGAAIITLDADGQHPVELIPDFLKRWHTGDKVVVGIRVANQDEGWGKRFGSKLFYMLFNKFTGIKLVPGSTDFRLIDRSVQQDFVRMTERNRITRGLIDWLGYERSYIEFKANPRLAGEPGYSFAKLFKLAIDSVISLSVSPLYVASYMGVIILPISILVSIFMLADTVFGDPLNLHLTGGAYVMILELFLIGVLLISQGIIGLYLSHIHTETQNRPLYIIDKENSIGLS